MRSRKPSRGLSGSSFRWTAPRCGVMYQICAPMRRFLGAASTCWSDRPPNRLRGARNCWNTPSSSIRSSRSRIAYWVCTTPCRLPCGQELRTAAVALHRSTESLGAEAEVGWRETRRGQFCRRRDGRGAKNGERDYPKSPREERGSHRLREPGGQGRDGWELAARDGVSGIRRGRGWAAETWTDNDTTGAPRPAWKAHIDAPTWSAARQKQNIGRRSPRESG